MAVSRPLLIGGGFVTFASTAYASYLLNKPDTTTRSGGLPDSSSRIATYEKLAPTYDAKIHLDETVMGMSLLRRFLIGNAKGEVLEVATGTGRNMPFYPSSCTSLTVTDASRAMLEVAVTIGRQKECAAPVTLAVKTTAEGLVASMEGRQFDTVVDTFGLCSFDDPVEALRQMQACCKEGGKILLLEHGKSSWLPWLTQILDKHVEKHAAKWGCVWNRDIMNIIEQSGLIVESKHVYHFGTTYYIIGRPGNYREKEGNRKSGPLIATSTQCGCCNHR